ncbi:MAG: presenilin family intramembrane aspartyl protease [Dehalococcoidia bacterium]|nr:presenilin family intramembrane aspartyl protease [Dehalococcoidia bacterium]
MSKPVESKGGLHPFFSSGLLLIASQVLSFYLAFRERELLESSQITLPETSLGLPLAYFFGAVALVGLILFLLPLAAIRTVLKMVFLFLFVWGVFICLAFLLPVPWAVGVSVIAVALYRFKPRIWLHNLLMVVTLASVGAVFGVLFSPLTAILFMLVISVYDIVAVRFGFMMWMVKRMAVSDTLPVFVIPRTVPGWKQDMKEVRLFEDRSEREFSVLGGGDVGFPLLLVVSVFFADGFARSLIVAGFALLGLAGAYLVHDKLLKGRPTPALPPISILCIVGFAIARLIA